MKNTKESDIYSRYDCDKCYYEGSIPCPTHYPDKSESPLSCEVVDGELVIKIGINTLAWAARLENGGILDKEEVEIDNTGQFAKDVAGAIEKSDDAGNSLLTGLLDDAIKGAVDSGSSGLNYK